MQINITDILSTLVSEISTEETDANPLPEKDLFSIDDSVPPLDFDKNPARKPEDTKNTAESTEIMEMAVLPVKLRPEAKKNIGDLIKTDTIKTSAPAQPAIQNIIAQTEQVTRPPQTAIDVDEKPRSIGTTAPIKYVLDKILADPASSRPTTQPDMVRAPSPDIPPETNLMTASLNRPTEPPARIKQLPPVTVNIEVAPSGSAAAPPYPVDNFELHSGLRIRQIAPTLATPHVSVELPQEKLVQHISATIGQRSEGRFEVRLDPPELGKVTISISHTNNGVSAHIVADKADVADFLRRHADIFTRELDRSDMGNASLDFSHNEHPHAPPPEQLFFFGEASEAPVQKPAQKPQQTDTQTLDIRL